MYVVHIFYMVSLYPDAFGSFEHDDLARYFSAPNVFCEHVIDADPAKVANFWRRAALDERGRAVNRFRAELARLCSVHDDCVRAGKIFQVEPHGVLRRALDERVIIRLVCANLDRVITVENLGIRSSSSSSAQAQNQVNRCIFLDVIVQQGSPVLQLLSGINEPLLVGRNALLVLYFCLNGVNRISRLDFQRDCFASERFHENLHLC